MGVECPFIEAEKEIPGLSVLRPTSGSNDKEVPRMRLDRDYAAQVRKHLGYFPVWQPGDAIEPGDVGVLEHGVFRRQTTLSGIFSELKASIGSVAREGLTRFRSEDCSFTALQGSGTVPLQPGVINSAASLKLTFGCAGGAVFDAVNCRELYITNLYEVTTYVDQHRDKWPPNFKLATRVTDAKRFLVLISGASNASVDLSGDANALGSWNLANASITSTNEKNVGYQRSGNGPILVGLYGFGWFGKHLKVLSATEKMSLEAEFRELPARDPFFD